MDAIYSDGTELFRSPAEPKPFDEVYIRIRTGREDIGNVYFILNGSRYAMDIINQNKLFNYYETKIHLKEDSVKYYFEIQRDSGVIYYNRLGAKSEHAERGDFEIIPGFSVPDWAKGAVMYQIFTDRFCNGDKSNDVLSDEYAYINEHVSRAEDWNQLPREMDVREFYGGDIAGIIKKLDYLSDMGVEVIYLNPIFVSPSNHKYDIQDYDYVDPHFGKITEDYGNLLDVHINDNTQAERYKRRVTDKRNLEAGNELFCELVEKAHARGIKVILDGVFNHCGSFNKWLDRERIYENQEGYEKGAYISSDSPYRSFFKFNADEWPYNEKYDGWWGYNTLPKLNYEESEFLFNYIMRIAAKWVSPPFNADGWRLDVAADLGHSEEYNHRFWKAFRESVKKANPNAIILAEHYGSPKSWLRGNEWDTVMNYDAFMEPLSWFLTGMEKHSDAYREDLLGNADAFYAAITENMLNMTTPSLYTAMNELSNHDHSRFLTRTNHRVGRTHTAGSAAASEGVNHAIMRAAVIFQMTWPGAPTVYYGDEAGVCGWTDPDSRRTYPWGMEDKQMLSFHKEVIRIHRDYSSLKTGSLVFLNLEQNIICFGRFNECEACITAINISGEYKSIDVPVWKLGITEDIRMVSLIKSTRGGYSIHATVYPVYDGRLKLDLEPESSIIIKNITKIDLNFLNRVL